MWYCPVCGNRAIPTNTVIGALCIDCAPTRSCDKLAFATQAAAQYAAMALEVRRVGGDRFLAPVRDYCCRRCGAWHLTSS